MRNAEYWAQRAINEMLMSERSVLQYEESLLQVYTISLREIKKNIDSFYKKYATGDKITYSEARKRLVAAELKEFQTLVKQWLELANSQNWSTEYIKYLEKLSQAKYISRLEMLEADIRYEIESIEQGKHTDMTDLMSINYVAAYYDRSYTIAHGSEISVRFNAVDKAAVEKAVKTKWNTYNYSQTIWNDKDRLVRSLQTIIPQSFSRGLNSNQLGDMIAKELNASKNRARTLARTEVNFISNQADLDAYKVVGITEYDYLATLDMRTSEICRSLDGTTHKVSQAKIGVNYPPMHPNCRSTTVPHFDDTSELERVARDENNQTIKVPRKMTQEEYINTFVSEEDREKLLSFRNKFYPTD